jgi:hypothetical protein
MNELTTLTEEDWRKLAATIQSGDCVLLLGPAVAVDPSDPSHTPLTTLLARALAEKLGTRAPIDRDDLAHVAQLYRADHDRMDLHLAVESFYKAYEGLTTPLHRELAELPFKLCINTTHDSFMATAFEQAQVKKLPTIEYYDFREVHKIHLEESDEMHPIVFGLYGSLKKHGSLVLTESELLEFIINVSKNRPPLPSYITARFKNRATSFLFLGFGFEHWHVRVLLHVLESERIQRDTHSLALEESAFFSHEEHRIDFKLLSWEAFVTELKGHHDRLVGRSESGAQGTPTVFLCHSHADRAVVLKLKEQLEAMGISIWLDRQNLRGGEDWDRKIESALEREVDYVVVVQSCQMEARVESYVYKEVRVALERLKKVWGDFLFVIPVTIERCKGLPELGHLHTIDASTSEGAKQLGDTILADWARRPATAPRASRQD